MYSKIRLNLFELRSKENLVRTFNFFQKISEKWFTKEGRPNSVFFTNGYCKLCNNKEGERVFAVSNYNYYKCTSCDSLFVDPCLKPGVMESLFQDKHYQTFQSSLTKQSLELRKSHIENRKFNQIKDLLSSSNPSILDVGCGNGTFLTLCDNNGWKATGVDVSETALQHIKGASHIQTMLGSIRDMPESNRYDVITFWGELEHTHNPTQEIERAVELLSDNGLIIFEVPSADCIISKYLEKHELGVVLRFVENARHNVFFSRKWIDGIAVKFNLGIEYIESNGLDMQTIIMEELGSQATNKILDMQDILNDLLLGDHYRVFLRLK